MNLDEVGFVCPVLSKKNTDETYRLVGQIGCYKTPCTLLVDEKGRKHEVRGGNLTDMFTVESSIAINPYKGGELKGVAFYSPVMTKFSGGSVTLLALGVHQYTGKKFAIYRFLKRGGYWAEPVELFYDRFTPASSFVFGDHPRMIDPDGSVGFVVNESADDPAKHPPLMAYYHEDVGTFELSE